MEKCKNNDELKKLIEKAENVEQKSYYTPQLSHLGKMRKVTLSSKSASAVEQDGQAEWTNN